jgi:hypothetical protein
MNKKFKTFIVILALAFSIPLLIMGVGFLHGILFPELGSDAETLKELKKQIIDEIKATGDTYETMN